MRDPKYSFYPFLLAARTPGKHEMHSKQLLKEESFKLQQLETILKY